MYTQTNFLWNGYKGPQWKIQSLLVGLLGEGNFAFKNKNLAPSILPSKSSKRNKLNLLRLIWNYNPDVEFWGAGSREEKGVEKGKDTCISMNQIIKAIICIFLWSAAKCCTLLTVTRELLHIKVTLKKKHFWLKFRLLYFFHSHVCYIHEVSLKGL